MNVITLEDLSSFQEENKWAKLEKIKLKSVYENKKKEHNNLLSVYNYTESKISILENDIRDLDLVIEKNEDEQNKICDIIDRNRKKLKAIKKDKVSIKFKTFIFPKLFLSLCFDVKKHVYKNILKNNLSEFDTLVDENDKKIEMCNCFKTKIETLKKENKELNLKILQSKDKCESAKESYKTAVLRSNRVSREYCSLKRKYDEQNNEEAQAVVLSMV